MGLVTLMAALIGIWARPIGGYLSAFWVATAIVLGLMPRDKRNASLACWAAITLGFVAADILTHATWLKAIWLSAANLTGIACGWLLMRKMAPGILALRRKSSMLSLLMGCTAAALGSTAVGMWTGPVLFANTLGSSAILWFSSEMLNYALILPVMLSFPSKHNQDSLPHVFTRFSLTHFAPLLSLIVAEAAAYVVGGPGALAFTTPALLWCALSYSVFSTASLALLICAWKTIAVAIGAFAFIPEHASDITSLRLGLTLLSLGPLAVACSNAVRNELLQRLDRAVNFDYLTNVLARGAFLRQGQRMLERCTHDGTGAAVLMLDLDHFKRVNDRFGHAGGDALLCAFSQSLRNTLRSQDVFGRMGGEEFAIVLPEVSHNEALVIAKRLLNITRDLQVPLGKETIRVTVSIGLVHSKPIPAETRVEDMLLQADKALYEAKACGRDKVVALRFSSQNSLLPQAITSVLPEYSVQSL